jgi:hypothetical protein
MKLGKLVRMNEHYWGKGGAPPSSNNGVTGGKTYHTVDGNNKIFIDDNGNERTVEAWIFRVEEDMSKEKEQKPSLHNMNMVLKCGNCMTGRELVSDGVFVEGGTYHINTLGQVTGESNRVGKSYSSGVRTVSSSFFDWEFISLTEDLGEEVKEILDRSGPLSNDSKLNPKKAAGNLKAPMHCVPTLAMVSLNNVMAGGAYKYGYMNFREAGIDAQTYIGAIERHFLKYKDGVDFDKESKQHELAHIMACCAIMIDAHYMGNLVDNRSKTGKVEELLQMSEKEFMGFMENHDKELLARNK